MQKNMSIQEISIPVSGLLEALGSPARIAILIAIGRGEACVCHLGAILGWRQAYISQHLMALRKAEILRDRRQGRYVYYSLKDAAILSLLQDAAQMCELPPGSIESLSNPNPGPDCECPHCAPSLIPVGSLRKE